MSIYDIGNYLMQLLHESNTWNKYLYVPVFIVAVVLLLSILVGAFSYLWEKLTELEARIENSEWKILRNKNEFTHPEAACQP